jgi:hypothetical protein
MQPPSFPDHAIDGRIFPLESSEASHHRDNVDSIEDAAEDWILQD